MESSYGTVRLEVVGNTLAFCVMNDSPIHRWWVDSVRKKSWEQPVLEAFRRCVRPGDNVLDVGSWLGPYAILASQLVLPGGHVYAIEPDPVCRDLLEKSIAANGLTNVSIVNVAVTRENRTVSVVPRYHFGDSNTAVSHEIISGQRQVRGTSLQALCSSLSVHPDIVKVDVEGTEAEVLAGAGEVLRSARVVFVEAHHRYLESRGIRTAEFVKTAGCVTGKSPHILQQNAETTIYQFCRRE